MDTRALAAKTLHKVVNKSVPLDQALIDTLQNISQHNERGFIQELCYGTMRWYPRLEFIVVSLLDKPLKQKDGDIMMLLFLGLYQLEFMRTPEHAAVSSTVNACESLKKPWAKNLINAILRRYLREKLKIQEAIHDDQCAHYAHPEWLIDRFRKDWPEHWTGLLEKANQYPPFHLRVNLSLNSRDEYLQLLNDDNLKALPLPLVDSAIVLEPAISTEKLPGFNCGKVSVQDQGAQLAASLLCIAPGMRVLDACAAPGGKAAHICESQSEIKELVAIDKDDSRVALLESTRTRMVIDMTLVTADATKTESWWDGEMFDRILIDAPCSATGVMRRHPDIKILRKAEQISPLLAVQKKLLSALWLLLREGGIMVYSSCSLFREENDCQIEKHLRNCNDAELVKFDADWGIATDFGRQSLATTDDTDSFYYSVLKKKETN